MTRSADIPEPRPTDPDAPEGPTAPAPDYDEAGVPTFEHVRDRIEGRYATALGTTELVEESASGRSVAQQQEDRDAAARERLEQIRRSMRDE
jgi:phage shock protein A